MKRAYLYTLVVIATWAVSLVANKAMLLGRHGRAHLSPEQVAFWSIAVGWSVLLLLLAARGRLRWVMAPTRRGWLVLALMGLLGWSGYAVALNLAFSLLPLPDAIIINYLHPMFVVLFQGEAFGAVVRRLSGWERPPDRSGRPRAARLAAGFALCLLGVGLIAFTPGGHQGLHAGTRVALGAASALCAAFAWGAYSNLGRFVSFRPGTALEGASDLISFLAMSFGVLLLAGVLAVTGHLQLPLGYVTELHLRHALHGPVPVWAIMLMTGVVVYAGGFTLWLFALEIGSQHGRAHALPPLTYLTPVLAVLLGWVVLLEAPGARFWPGAALIAAGNAVILLSRGRKDERPRPTAGR